MMNERYLTILEVSQKQAYIFQSNELKKNIRNSAVIAWVMDADYLKETAGDEKLFRKEDNLVYSGGGHTVLEFPTRDQAASFTRVITAAIRREYFDIEIFATTTKYDDTKTPGENLKELTKTLERKKSERRAAFHQGSFGVEHIDTNTLQPIRFQAEKEDDMPEKERMTDEYLKASGYHNVFKFEELGGTRDKSNFIAVVHIDGNAMGKRVEGLQKQLADTDWTDYKKNLKAFSDSIDEDFKAAYKEMAEYVATNIQCGNLKDLNLSDKNFPIRRIITAGDDICFVAEGRIGLECAAAFIEKLSARTNSVDKEGYAACAGVAIVHQKYPFYKAYELAEMLCGNAKKYGASQSSDGTGSDISAIDWHVEFGEVKDTLDEIRAEYTDVDGNSVSARPYLVRAPQTIQSANPQRCYREFRRLIVKLQKEEGGARDTIKELRNAIGQGRAETEHFLRFHKIEELIKRDLSENIRVLFDAIELLDTFIALEDKGGSI